jgi:hypothetical protein
LNFPERGVSYAAPGGKRLRRDPRPNWEASTGPARDGRPVNNLRGDDPMKRTKTALFVATLFAAGTALASHCPQEMKKIDEALAKSPNITAAQMDEVKKYRAEGEALHKAGKHQESVDTLAKAEAILGIK